MQYKVGLMSFMVIDLIDNLFLIAVCFIKGKPKYIFVVTASLGSRKFFYELLQEVRVLRIYSNSAWNRFVIIEGVLKLNLFCLFF